MEIKRVPIIDCMPDLIYLDITREYNYFSICNPREGKIKRFIISRLRFIVFPVLKKKNPTKKITIYVEKAENVYTNRSH